MDASRTSFDLPYRNVDASEETPTPERGCWHSEELFGAKKEVVILHDGEEYRLRITRNNKLILTK